MHNLGSSPVIHNVAKCSTKCRFCGNTLEAPVLDLGQTPLCESLRREENFNDAERYYPLLLFVCDQCWLVQLSNQASPEEIFREYAYFSSVSTSWLAHAKKFASEMTERLKLDEGSFVVEVASNDGYLLRNFVERQIPCLGIEPARNVAAKAIDRGVASESEFWGVAHANDLLGRRGPADLIVANNVLAHVPDINDFVAGFAAALADDGVLSVEFPHLLQMLVQTQFDTIYHEHFSYLSLGFVERLFESHGLKVFDVEQLASHGGSLRVLACHASASEPWRSSMLAEVRAREAAFGLGSLSTYEDFAKRVQGVKRSTIRFLLDAAEHGEKVVGYGAPGKCVTFLHYCGIDADLLSVTADRNTYKQGSFLPGTSIRIVAPEVIDQIRPDYVFVLPWNLEREITTQLAHIRSWGGKFVFAIPELRVV